MKNKIWSGLILIFWIGVIIYVLGIFVKGFDFALFKDELTSGLTYSLIIILVILMLSSLIILYKELKFVKKLVDTFYLKPLNRLLIRFKISHKDTELSKEDILYSTIGIVVICYFTYIIGIKFIPLFIVILSRIWYYILFFISLIFIYKLWKREKK